MPQLTKRQVLEKVLELGLAKVVVFTKIDGVSLPAHLMQSDHCMLNLSRKFKGRMEFTPENVEVDLSFNKKSFPVILPWDSIVRIIDNNGDHHVFRTEIEQAVKDVFDNAKTVPEEKADFEVLLDRTEELKLQLIQGGGEITPPISGHLRLLKN